MSVNRCFACMQPIDSQQGVCPHCGYDNHVRDNGLGYLPEVLLYRQYQIGKMLGRGGFGVTYIGYDINLERRVAVKEYFPRDLAARDPNAMTLSAYLDCADAFKSGCERALRESRMAASLGRIPGIVMVHNAISENNTIYIIMEYVEGVTLSAYVKEHGGKLAFAEALELLGPIAVALDKLHEAGIVHRDVKPENIMVRRGTKETVLLDFGAARVLDNRTMSLSSQIYTVGYAPPEQCSTAAAIDARLDQYAFCGTLYYVLTGEEPVDCQLRMFTSQEMKPINELNDSVPKGAEAVIMKGMSLKPEERYASMRELMQAIEAGSAKLLKTGGPVTTSGAAKKGHRKGPVIAVCAALLAGGALWAANGLRTNRELPFFAMKPTVIPVPMATPVSTLTPTLTPTSTIASMLPDQFEIVNKYVKLIKDVVNLRSAPSMNCTSLARVPIDTVLSVKSQQFNDECIWYEVDYNGLIGYIREDMAIEIDLEE